MAPERIHCLKSMGSESIDIPIHHWVRMVNRDSLTRIEINPIVFLD